MSKGWVFLRLSLDWSLNKAKNTRFPSRLGNWPKIGWSNSAECCYAYAYVYRFIYIYINKYILHLYINKYVCNKYIYILHIYIYILHIYIYICHTYIYIYSWYVHEISMTIRRCTAIRDPDPLRSGQFRVALDLGPWTSQERDMVIVGGVAYVYIYII